MKELLQCKERTGRLMNSSDRIGIEYDDIHMGRVEPVSPMEPPGTSVLCELVGMIHSTHSSSYVAEESWSRKRFRKL